MSRSVSLFRGKVHVPSTNPKLTTRTSKQNYRMPTNGGDIFSPESPAALQYLKVSPCFCCWHHWYMQPVSIDSLQWRYGGVLFCVFNGFLLQGAGCRFFHTDWIFVLTEFIIPYTSDCNLQWRDSGVLFSRFGWLFKEENKGGTGAERREGVGAGVAAKGCLSKRKEERKGREGREGRESSDGSKGGFYSFTPLPCIPSLG